MTFKFRKALLDINWPTEKPVPVVFVVPEEIYSEFQAQIVEYGTATSKNGAFHEQFVNVPDYKVKQFVMCIDSTKQDIFEKIGALSMMEVENFASTKF